MRPLRFTIGTGMLAVAIVAVACAGLRGASGMSVGIALAVTLPWLLVWMGLCLSGLWTKVPGLSKKSANLDCNDL